jgi:hypothetical protein
LACRPLGLPPLACRIALAPTSVVIAEFRRIVMQAL